MRRDRALSVPCGLSGKSFVMMSAINQIDMPQDPMLFAHLESFVEVARRGNVSRAAEALFLTQPAITARLKSLETGHEALRRGPGIPPLRRADALDGRRGSPGRRESATGQHRRAGHRGRTRG